MAFLKATAKGVVPFFFTDKRQGIRERRYDEIDHALNLLQEKKTIKEGLRKYINGNKIDHGALQLAERYDGVSVIFSTRRWYQNHFDIPLILPSLV